jgi:hypothetical protein
MNDEPQKLHVLCGIQEVMKAFADKGIAKAHKNESQGFKFRGIDDVMNRMAQHLVEAQLVIVPSIRTREVNERVNSRGNPLFYVTVLVDFTVYSTIDGSSVVCTVPGEAMDSGDKATNKALSIAYKYMAFQLFAIPIDEDPDRHTHEVGRSSDITFSIGGTGGASKPVTKEEAEVIRKLLSQTDVTEEKLIELYKVGDIESLPQLKLQEITKKLQGKIKQKEEA